MSQRALEHARAEGPKSSADGWRGQIGSSFTCASALRIIQAIMDVHEDNSGGHRILLTHDTRGLGPDVVSAAAQLIGNRDRAYQVVCVQHLPTATASFLTVQDFDLAILVTASHNPANWNGIKLKIAPGLPAPPDTVAAIDRRIAGLGMVSTPSHGAGVDIEAATGFIRSHVASITDGVAGTRRLPFRVVVDGLGGVAAPSVEALGAALNWQVVNTGRPPSATFGGQTPDPSNPAARAALERQVVRHEADFGIALDGDGDRVFIVDETGYSVQPHDLLALLIFYENRKGRPIRSVALTQSMGISARLAARHVGATLIETEIGFKYLAQHLFAGHADVAGGSVGDLAFRTRSTDRDPLAVAAHLSEALSDSGERLSVEIQKVRGLLGTERLIWLESHIADAGSPGIDDLADSLRRTGRDLDLGPCQVDHLAGGAARLRGAAHQWLMLRPSTTEGGLRLYGELANPEPDLAAMVSATVAAELTRNGLVSS